MLLWRVTISALLIPILIAAFYFDAHWGKQAPVLLVFVAIVAWRSSSELVDLLRTRSFTPNRILVVTASVLVAISSWYGRFPHMPIAIASDGNTLAQVALTYSCTVLILFLFAAYRYREPGQSMETLGAELLIVSYIGVLLGVATQLRWVAGADAGYLVIGSLLIVVKSGDIGAYFLGKYLGRRKMAPHLSPGKTWAGAVGALLGSALGSVLWLQFATPFFAPRGVEWLPPDWPWSACYGLVLGVVGLIGDLCESLIKRDVGKKDSASLFPGFGGLLDLADSVLYAGPVAYILWKALPLATWKFEASV